MWEYSVIYEVHLNQLSCSFPGKDSYIGISFFSELIMEDILLQFT